MRNHRRRKGSFRATEDYGAREQGGRQNALNENTLTRPTVCEAGEKSLQGSSDPNGPYEAATESGRLTVEARILLLGGVQPDEAARQANRNGMGAIVGA